MGYIANVPNNISDSVGSISLQLWKRTKIQLGGGGHVPADGQELSQVLFPDLFAHASSGIVSTIDESSWWADPTMRGCWVLSSKTPGMFRVPDLNGAQAGSFVLFGRGGASDAAVGVIKQDQFQGHEHTQYYQYSGSEGWTNNGGLNDVRGTTSTTGIVAKAGYDTPRIGTETYPSHFQGIWVIRAFGSVVNAGVMDAAQLATQVAALQAQLSVLSQPVSTGSVQFVRATNEILMHGIVTDLGLEVGDVIQISGSASNNLTVTVEVLTDANDINVNYEHRNGAGSLSLTNETVTCTIKRLAKRYNAPLGLGQAWVNVTSKRATAASYVNTTGRTIVTVATGAAPANGSSPVLTVNGSNVGLVGGGLGTTNPVYGAWPGLVPNGGSYGISGGAVISMWSELR